MEHGHLAFCPTLCTSNVATAITPLATVQPSHARYFNTHWNESTKYIRRSFLALHGRIRKIRIFDVSKPLIKTWKNSQRR